MGAQVGEDNVESATYLDVGVAYLIDVDEQTPGGHLVDTAVGFAQIGLERRRRSPNRRC